MNITQGLIASQSYLDALPEVVARVVNGCGPGGWKVDLIPDTVLGLSIEEACNIHDWDYTEGSTGYDKCIADDRFLLNCLFLIENAKGFWAIIFRHHRKLRAYEYHLAVSSFGHDAFWKGKEKRI